MDKIMNFFSKYQVYMSILIIIVGAIIYFILKKLLDRYSDKNKNNEKISKKKRTYVRLLKNVLKYIILIIVVILVLQANGVNVTSILASLGVVSIIAGLALQDALKDIIMGFNIIMDDYFSVGDVIKIGDVEGKVIELGIKATKIKDVNNQNVLVIANRNIGQALKLSNQLDIDIPLPYEEKILKIEGVLNEIITQIKLLNDVEKVEYKGVNEFADSSMYYKIRISCKPQYKPQLKRDANRIIKVLLDKNNITIPYSQLVIHDLH